MAAAWPSASQTPSLSSDSPSAPHSQSEPGRPAEQLTSAAILSLHMGEMPTTCSHFATQSLSLGHFAAAAALQAPWQLAEPPELSLLPQDEARTRTAARTADGIRDLVMLDLLPHRIR